MIAMVWVSSIMAVSVWIVNIQPYYTHLYRLNLRALLKMNILLVNSYLVSYTQFLTNSDDSLQQYSSYCTSITGSLLPLQLMLTSTLLQLTLNVMESSISLSGKFNTLCYHECAHEDGTYLIHGLCTIHYWWPLPQTGTPRQQK